MPKITIELTDTQAGKVMALNGWKPEELHVIVKRMVLEKLTAPVAPARLRPPAHANRMVPQVMGEHD